MKSSIGSSSGQPPSKASKSSTGRTSWRSANTCRPMSSQKSGTDDVAGRSRSKSGRTWTTTRNLSRGGNWRRSCRTLSTATGRVFTTHLRLGRNHKALYTPFYPEWRGSARLQVNNQFIRGWPHDIPNPQSPIPIPHSALRTPHSALRTPHSAFRIPPSPNHPFRGRQLTHPAAILCASYTQHISRFTFHASRFTFHVSRFTHHTDLYTRRHPL